MLNRVLSIRLDSEHLPLAEHRLTLPEHLDACKVHGMALAEFESATAG